VKRAAFVFVLLGLLAGMGYGRTWHVPSEAPTFQAAIDSADSGDTIEIAPGLYDDCSTPAEDEWGS
jgi:hypothetical protein